MRVRTLVFLGLSVAGCGNGVEGEPFPDPEPQSTSSSTAEDPPSSEPSANDPPTTPSPEPTPPEPTTPVPPAKPRVVLIHTAHGTAFDNWVRSSDRYDFELGPELALFSAYRDAMLVLDGFHGPDENTFGLGAYDWGPSFAFTGDAFVAPLDYGDWHRSNRPGRATLERELAAPETRFRTLALAYAPPRDLAPSVAGMGTFFVAASGRGLPTKPYDDLRAVHTLLTDGVIVTDPTAAATVSSLAEWMANANLGDAEVRARTHPKLIAAALATDQTRGVVYQATHVWERFDNVGLNELAHYYDAAGRTAHDAARMVIAKRVAAVVDELAATPFCAGGTVLDHTVVVWVDDTGFGYEPHAAHACRSARARPRNPRRAVRERYAHRGSPTLRRARTAW